jgi:hypothetical protein
MIAKGGNKEALAGDGRPVSYVSRLERWGEGAWRGWVEKGRWPALLCSRKLCAKTASATLHGRGGRGSVRLGREDSPS